MSKKITGKMLKTLIEEAFSNRPREHQPLPVEKPKAVTPEEPIHAKSLGDLPNAWDSEERNVVFDLEEFDWRSEEEIFKDQVRFKWKQFKNSLSQREQAILRALLGFDVKRYSVEELENLQGALKGKSSK
jgi:hypothetical protein